MILLLTHDLMMTSNVSIAARQRGISFRSVRTIEKALIMLEEGNVEILLIDLQTPDFILPDLQHGLQELATVSPPKTIAFAQHVFPDLLKQARSCGFDQVLTRGQFTEQIAALI